MFRGIWIGLIGALAVAGWCLETASSPAPRRASAPVQHTKATGIEAERLEGVRSTLVTPDGRVVRVTAERIESSPVRLFGPIRLGFLQSAVASDVHVEFDARDPQSADARPHDVTRGFSARSFGLSHGSLVGLQFDGFQARIIDPIGRLLTVRAQRCEMESPSSLMCFKGRLNFDAHEATFARARFDGAHWQIVEGAPSQSAAPDALATRAERQANACAVESPFGARAISAPLCSDPPVDF